MMSAAHSSQNTYARLLAHAEPERGYHLWSPEPSLELAPKYPHEGVRIGDVGVITPHGNFDVFFNICLREDHPLHHPHGVPDGFKHIKLSEKDVEVVEDPDYHGSVVTKENSKVNINVTGANPNFVTIKGSESELTTEGAVIAVPTGVVKHDLHNTSVFQMEAMRMGKTWYEFALNKLGRTTISHDSLYLITGYHKVSWWTNTVFCNPTGMRNLDVRYTALADGKVKLTSREDKLRSIPCRGSLDGQKNHAITVRGFKIAIKEKTFSSLLPSSKGKGLLSITPSSHDYSPPIHKIYHPLDGINSILLDQTRRCNMVVTHDNMWKDIVHEFPSTLSHSHDMVAAIKKKGYVVSSHAGCAYFTKCGADDPMHSGCTGFTLSFGVDHAVAKLVHLVKKKKNKKPKYVDSEEKGDKASLGSVDSEYSE